MAAHSITGKFFSDVELRSITRKTLQHYEQNASSFCDGTKHHDVSQNIQSLLSHISVSAPLNILDFGCGPGRDLIQFAALGHTPVGLDGSAAFVAMARECSGCEVLHQDFLDLDLPTDRFDGVFANASLFHVPRQKLPRVLRELCESLKPGGILFTSNPRGNNEEGWSGDRYGCFYDRERWCSYIEDAGFQELQHYYRPPGKPCEQQPWLATVCRKIF
jgi:SAM-dependent methyltransferase